MATKSLERLQFSTMIAAPLSKVWDAMFGQESYRDWASAFMDGSYYEGEWREGASIRFLGPSEGGGTGGMSSRIRELRRNEFVAIEHLGLIRDGVEDTTSEEARNYAGALEQYTFTELDGVTEVRVAMDATDEDREGMTTAWPKALRQLKELVEGS